MHPIWIDIKIKLGDLAREAEEVKGLVGLYEAGSIDSRLAGRAFCQAVMSLYTGMEGVMKLLAAELDGGAPRGDDWHSILLRRMAEPTDIRPPLISAELYAELTKMLGMRHKIVHSYGFHYDIAIIVPAIKRALQVVADFGAEVAGFFSACQGTDSAPV